MEPIMALDGKSAKVKVGSSSTLTVALPEPSISAVMFSGGWLTAVSVASAGAAAGLPVVSLGAGCMYFSFGFFYLLFRAVWHDLRLPSHSPSGDSFEDEPLPYWLDTRTLNWGVVGRVGAGKSSLVNALRGVSASSPEGAAVGIGHTTWQANPYLLPLESDRVVKDLVRLWDLPGAGTLDWPAETYIAEAGLRYFDALIFVISSAPLDDEVKMLQRLRDFQIPHYVVRSKVDQDVVNNEEDNGAAPEDTLAEVRKELLSFGCCETENTFLISSRHASYDFEKLLRITSSAISKQCLEVFGSTGAVKLARCTSSHAID